MSDTPTIQLEQSVGIIRVIMPGPEGPPVSMEAIRDSFNAMPIRVNPSSVSSSFSVPTDSNASSVGPLTINSGVVVTLAGTAYWSII